MKKLFTILVMAGYLITGCKKEAVNAPDQPAVTQQVPVKPEAILEQGVSNVITSLARICGSQTVSLMAGQHIPVGTITVQNDETNLYVTFNLTGDYKLAETHVYAGPASRIPLSSNGNAAPGRFPYKAVHNPEVSSYTYTIPLSALSASCNAIAAHCVVISRDAAGTIVFNETAWGSGTRINPSGSWATYFDYCRSTCGNEEE